MSQLSVDHPHHTVQQKGKSKKVEFKCKKNCSKHSQNVSICASSSVVDASRHAGQGKPGLVLQVVHVARVDLEFFETIIVD